MSRATYATHTPLKPYCRSAIGFNIATVNDHTDATFYELSTAPFINLDILPNCDRFTTAGLNFPKVDASGNRSQLPKPIYIGSSKPTQIQLGKKFTGANGVQAGLRLILAEVKLVI